MPTGSVICLSFKNPNFSAEITLTSISFNLSTINVDVFVTWECIHLYILYFIGPRCSYRENHLYFFVPRCSYPGITKSHEEVPSVVSRVISTLVVVTQAYITKLGLLNPT